MELGRQTTTDAENRQVNQRWVSGWLSEWVGGWLSGWVGEWVGKWVSGRMGKWAGVARGLQEQRQTDELRQTHGQVQPGPGGAEPGQQSCGHRTDAEAERQERCWPKACLRARPLHRCSTGTQHQQRWFPWHVDQFQGGWSIPLEPAQSLSVWGCSTRKFSAGPSLLLCTSTGKYLKHPTVSNCGWRKGELS